MNFFIQRIAGVSIDELIRSTFGVVFGKFPTVETCPPHELIGTFLCDTEFSGGGSWLFTQILPALEELREGRRQSVRASSEVVYLEASETGVVFSDDIESQPCTVPLDAFIDLLRGWRQHVETVREARGQS